MDTTTRALERHAPETVAAAHGRCVVLYQAVDAWGALPAAVTKALRLDELAPGCRVDSALSIGQLGCADDLGHLAAKLASHAHSETDLLFCEPTAAHPGDRRANDVTADLWAAGWSIVDCRRFRIGRGRSAHEMVWGRARIVRRPSVPPGP